VTLLTLHVPVGASGARVVAVVLLVDHKDLRGGIRLHVRASVPGEAFSSPSWEYDEPEDQAEGEFSASKRDVVFYKCKTGENKTNLMI
jgi:hypothetical protein